MRRHIDRRQFPLLAATWAICSALVDFDVSGAGLLEQQRHGRRRHRYR